jgi:hypothetical protein
VAAIRQQHKSLALSYLRSRKQFEDALTQRLGSLEILQSTLLRIEGAAENIQVTCLAPSIDLPFRRSLIACVPPIDCEDVRE